MLPRFNETAVRNRSTNIVKKRIQYPIAMFFWENLANFVGMKNSIDFLPERKQRDLHELVGLIREEVKDVVMIILYGSYARNTYVELDERRDFGVKTYYISDYDILIVTRKRMGSGLPTIKARINDRFIKGKSIEFQTRPQIINESISKFNNALSEGRYFYVDILTQGIVLYDSGECQLATPRELNYSEILQMAEEYYNGKLNRATCHYDYFELDYSKERYTYATYNLHQVVEHLLKAIPLVFILYGHKEHELDTLVEKCKAYTLELAKVFPRDTEEEKQLFELLERSYIEARYNDNFVVPKEVVDALVPKVDLLFNIVEDVCQKQFDYYKQQTTK